MANVGPGKAAVAAAGGGGAGAGAGAGGAADNKDITLIAADGTKFVVPLRVAKMSNLVQTAVAEGGA